MDFVRKSSHKRDLIVVSSDRALASFVNRQGGRTISSGQFRRLLEDTANVASSMEKSGREGSVDLEEWLEFFKSK